jgi:hypothetical protein
MKYLIVCVDGTWQQPFGGTSYPTNVQIISEILSTVQQNAPAVIHYEAGVGTGYDPYNDGLYGRSVPFKIKNIYKFLVDNYEEGDQIYCFGFSRGAFIVRSLVALIHHCGLLKKGAHYNARMIEEIVDNNYLKRGRHRSLHYPLFPAGTVEIAYMGLFDTVHGLTPEARARHPVETLIGVARARHAIAQGEPRAAFNYDSWNHVDPSVTTHEQKVFLGSHADVGGGWDDFVKYRDDRGDYVLFRLANIPLLWILEGSGLRVRPHPYTHLPPPPPYDPRRPMIHYTTHLRNYCHSPLSFKDMGGTFQGIVTCLVYNLMGRINRSFPAGSFYPYNHEAPPVVSIVAGEHLGVGGGYHYHEAPLVEVVVDEPADRGVVMRAVLEDLLARLEILIRSAQQVDVLYDQQNHVLRGIIADHEIVRDRLLIKRSAFQLTNEKLLRRVLSLKAVMPSSRSRLIKECNELIDQLIAQVADVQSELRATITLVQGDLGAQMVFGPAAALGIPAARVVAAGGAAVGGAAAVAQAGFG